MSNPNHSPQYEDLSFLDDFNIDEIVEWMNNCEDTCNNLNLSKEQDKITCTNQNATNYYKNTTQISNEFGIENKKVESNKITDSLIEGNINHNIHEKIFCEDITINKENVKTVDSEIKIAKGNHQYENKSKVLIPKIEAEKINVHVTLKDNVTITKQFNNNRNTPKTNNINQVYYKYNVVSEQNCNLRNLESSLVNDRSINTIQTANITPGKLNCTNELQNQPKALYVDNKEPNNCMNIRKYSPKSVIQCKADIILCKNLKRRMVEYLHEEYYVKSVIHYGNYSKIFKCFDTAGQPYAVKMLSYEWSKFEHSLKQDKIFMDVQADIQKENLYTVFVFNTFSIEGHWCFLMEFQTKNLKEALEESTKPFHIDLIQDLARQLVAAVKSLKNNKIIHSDIKPSHILLNTSNTRLKLCGFDAAYYSKDIKISPNIGSENYRPPEVILGFSAGFSIDVWTTALVLHEMATRIKLFAGYHNGDILHKQICTLGTVPFEMLQGSLYKSRYFVGGLFRKRFGYKGQKTALLSNFYINYKLQSTVNSAYSEYWDSTRTKMEREKDLNKIRSFLELLDKMLAICPNYRIPIEHVDAEPFIYEISDL